MRIPSECGNVALNPFQGGDLVHQCVVGHRSGLLLGRQCGMREETKAGQAVVETDEHDAVTRKGGAVVDSR